MLVNFFPKCVFSSQNIYTEVQNLEHGPSHTRLRPPQHSKQPQHRVPNLKTFSRIERKTYTYTTVTSSGRDLIRARVTVDSAFLTRCRTTITRYLLQKRSADRCRCPVSTLIHHRISYVVRLSLSLLLHAIMISIASLLNDPLSDEDELDVPEELEETCPAFLPPIL
jgi:hypothetical protein